MYISRSLLKTLRRSVFKVTSDHDFSAVIKACASVRESQGEETWITDQLSEAFMELHEMGYAHSIECWQDGVLTGGLYGVCLGRCFFGESMFHTSRDSSKVALAHLLRMAEANAFELIDCQLPNEHLTSLGAKVIPRTAFMSRLIKAGVQPSETPEKGIFKLPTDGFSDW